MDLGKKTYFQCCREVLLNIPICFKTSFGPWSWSTAMSDQILLKSKEDKKNSCDFQCISVIIPKHNQELCKLRTMGIVAQHMWKHPHEEGSISFLPPIIYSLDISENWSVLFFVHTWLRSHTSVMRQLLQLFLSQHYSFHKTTRARKDCIFTYSWINAYWSSTLRGKSTVTLYHLWAHFSLW